MKKLVLSAVVVLAVGASSAFAQSCGGCGDKDKDKKKPSPTPTPSQVVSSLQF